MRGSSLSLPIAARNPSRPDLVRTLTERAVAEMTAVLTEISASGAEADAVWAGRRGR